MSEALIVRRGGKKSGSKAYNGTIKPASVTTYITIENPFHNKDKVNAVGIFMNTNGMLSNYLMGLTKFIDNNYLWACLGGLGATKIGYSVDITDDTITFTNIRGINSYNFATIEYHWEVIGNE